MRLELLECIESDGDFEALYDRLVQEEHALQQWQSGMQQLHNEIVADLFDNQGQELINCLSEYAQANWEPTSNNVRNVFSMLSAVSKHYSTHPSPQPRLMQGIAYLEERQAQLEKLIADSSLVPEPEIEEEEQDPVLPDPHLDQIKWNLMQLKSHVVHCNTMMVDEFAAFQRNQPATQGNKLKQFLLKKKEPTLVPISAELQKSQHMYFKTMQGQLEKINELVKSTVVLNPIENESRIVESLGLVWDHFVLISFMLKDLQQTVEHSFYFLNFYVSSLKLLELAIENLQDDMHFRILDGMGHSQQLIQLQQTILGFQLSLKREIGVVNRDLSKKYRSDV